MNRLISDNAVLFCSCSMQANNLSLVSFLRGLSCQFDHAAQSRQNCACAGARAHTHTHLTHTDTYTLTLLSQFFVLLSRVRVTSLEC